MIQAMTSQAGGGSGRGYAGSAQRGQTQGLARQGSLCSLTLDEVQNQLGEPLLSMNLDELLKSVFPDAVDTDGGGGVANQSEQASGLQRQGSIAMPLKLSKKTLDELWKGIQDAPKRSAEEGGQRRQESFLMTWPAGAGEFPEGIKSVFPDGVGIDGGGGVASQSEQASGLQRQGSIAMPPELSKKTLDELWKGIQDAPKRSAEEGGQRRQGRQPTLGEMTLEDFLVKAGVVMEGYLKDLNDLPANMDAVGSSVIAAGAPNLNHGAQWLQQYQQQALEPQHPSMAGSYMASHLGPQPLAVGTGAILESIYSDGQSSSPMLGALSDPQTPGRKRSASGAVPDKVVERRQKRMIKNRESAARSRARKQAYTNELENKVSRLEEENERLKRQKELNKILFSAPPPEPKYQLRRTSSSLV